MYMVIGNPALMHFLVQSWQTLLNTVGCGPNIKKSKKRKNTECFYLYKVIYNRVNKSRMVVLRNYERMARESFPL